jgi:DNA repair photolyase
VKSYKYYLALTSQLPFCSVPLRIDTYNNCQFGCAFCFSKARGGNANSTDNQAIKVENLHKRLSRVFNGDVRNAIDEFLAKRIPAQLGGMNDPFSPWEIKNGVTKETLKVLAQFDYPTILSTKSTLVSNLDIISILSLGNFYVRQSITPVPEKLSTLLERGVPSTEDRLRSTYKLANAGIPVSIRLQPIILGYEKHAQKLIVQAADSGARHISAEYMKWPIEYQSKQFKDLDRVFPKMLQEYKRLGANLIGREWVLPSETKFKALEAMQSSAQANGMIFGFAENEFLLLNSFESCCNGADVFLRDSSFFEANITGILKKQLRSKNIKFKFNDDFWLPSFNVFSHLNSKSRPRKTPNESNRERWIHYLTKKWNSHKHRGGPESYWGVESTGEHDVSGNKIFKYIYK